MKIIVDDKIPYIKGALEPFAEVIYLPGNKTTSEVVKDADAIITRTRTICNEKLLTGSSVRLIASATIGFDHIDTQYCAQAKIAWTNAPGCNSKSVEQYIASALVVLAREHNLVLAGKTIGIIGIGNVGSKVARIARILGMNALLNDPPRARAEGNDGFVGLSHLLQESDFITLHVPLNLDGIDKTLHLADEVFYAGTTRNPFIINSCRGEVVSKEALKKAVITGKISGVVMDCWENEPDIDVDLLHMIDLGTPHIAGYSKDGKAKGTSMSVQAVSRFFNLGIDDWECSGIELPESTVIEINGQYKSDQQILSEAILATYDIRNDDHALRNAVDSFEKLRGDYPIRREFPVYEIKANNIEKSTIEKLRYLGFTVM